MEYSSLQLASPLRELTCHNYGITQRYPAVVTFPPLTQSGWYSI